MLAPLDHHPIEQIVILGGGVSAWMCAAALARLIAHAGVKITLVEPYAVEASGIGQASLPSLLEFNRRLGIDENDFMRATQATFKLGTQFVGWHHQDNRYFHAFEPYGMDLQSVKFHQLWQRIKAHPDYGDKAGDFSDYNLAIQAALRNRFARSESEACSATGAGAGAGDLHYGFHLDAGRYADYLRHYCEAAGVKRIAGTVQQVQQQVINGFIEAITLDDGLRIEGDLFIDCSGVRGMLIEQTLAAGYENWEHWLPCNRMQIATSKVMHKVPPYSAAIADAAGWRWKIPLQNAISHGSVYAGHFLSDDKAREQLLQAMGSAPATEPKSLSFTVGHRKKFWHKNCIAIGLAAGFIEPLESTSLHLIQTSITKLLALFPDKHFSKLEIAEYNLAMTKEFQSIRDFVILHYKATRRADTEFWRYVQAMPIPDSLEAKISLFHNRGRVFRTGPELFSEDSWIAVMLGQGIWPRGYDPLADAMPLKDTCDHLVKLKQSIATSAQALPEHAEFIARQVNLC